MSAWVFRVMGGLLLIFVPFFVLGAAVAGISYVLPAYRLRAAIGFGLMAVVFVVVGVGLLYLRKWAAVAFSIMTAGYGFVAIRQAVAGITHPVPGRADWLGFVFGIIALLPSFLTIKGWDILVWRRKPI
jgi:hypothetical protein